MRLRLEPQIQVRLRGGPRLDAGGHLVLIDEVFEAQASEELARVDVGLGGDVGDGLVGLGFPSKSGRWRLCCSAAES